MRDQILSEVREQPFFSISADEAVECSNKEQMPFVIRFVDSSDNIKEEFLDFILCDQGITGEAIARKLTQELDVLSLSVKNVRVQCYDGAGNMAGSLNDAAAIVQRKPGASKAKYFHCTAHALNLCIVGMSNVIPVRNMWSVLKQVALFFNNSPKRQQSLEQCIATIFSESACKKVVNLCKTR